MAGASGAAAIVTDVARAPRRLQRLRRRDHLPRRAAGAAGARPQPPRRLWRRHRPADLLRSLRLLPRLVRRQSGPDARAIARLGGGHRLARTTRSSRAPPISRRGSGTRSSTRSIPSPSSRAPPMPPGRAAATGSSSAPPAARGAALNLAANYTWLDAERAARRRRRPGARGAAAAAQRQLIAYGALGRFRWGASLAYVGRRRDTDFDLFPAATVTLGDYVLASANLAYRLRRQLEAYRAGRECVRRRLSGRGRLQHAGTDGLCGSSRRFRRLASRSPRRRPPRRARVASLNLCTDELVLALAAPRADRLGHPSRPAAGGNAALAAGAALSPQRRQPAVGRGAAARSRRDDGRRRARPAAHRRAARHPHARSAVRAEPRRRRRKHAAAGARRWAASAAGAALLRRLARADPQRAARRGATRSGSAAAGGPSPRPGLEAQWMALAGLRQRPMPGRPGVARDLARPAAGGAAAQRLSARANIRPASAGCPIRRRAGRRRRGPSRPTAGAGPAWGRC